jgi:hypothetical protein
MFGVPYGSRTRVAAVKEKRPMVIQWNYAAWIALYRSSRTQGNAYWTFNGRVLALGIAANFASGQRILRTLERVPRGLTNVMSQYLRVWRLSKDRFGWLHINTYRHHLSPISGMGLCRVAAVNETPERRFGIVTI